MFNDITFTTTKDGKGVKITKDNTTYSSQTARKICENIQQIKIKPWQSKLTLTMLITDALEDALPGARIFPLDVSKTFASVHANTPHEYEFLIIEG